MIEVDISKMSPQQKKEYYYQLMHAVQSGTKFYMSWATEGRGSKIAQEVPSEFHLELLRAGLANVMCEFGAIVDLLMKKGILTEEEVINKFIEYYQSEVRSYERKISQVVKSKSGKDHVPDITLI